MISYQTGCMSVSAFVFIHPMIFALNAGVIPVTLEADVLPVCWVGCSAAAICVAWCAVAAAVIRASLSSLNAPPLPPAVGGVGTGVAVLLSVASLFLISCFLNAARGPSPIAALMVIASWLLWGSFFVYVIVVVGHAIALSVSTQCATFSVRVDGVSFCWLSHFVRKVAASPGVVLGRLAMYRTRGSGTRRRRGRTTCFSSVSSSQLSTPVHPFAGLSAIRSHSALDKAPSLRGILHVFHSFIHACVISIRNGSVSGVSSPTSA